jgi:hypothetical protein
MRKYRLTVQLRGSCRQGTDSAVSFLSQFATSLTTSLVRSRSVLMAAPKYDRLSPASHRDPWTTPTVSRGCHFRGWQQLHTPGSNPWAVVRAPASISFRPQLPARHLASELQGRRKRAGLMLTVTKSSELRSPCRVLNFFFHLRVVLCFCLASPCCGVLPLWKPPLRPAS